MPRTAQASVGRGRRCAHGPHQRLIRQMLRDKSGAFDISEPFDPYAARQLPLRRGAIGSFTVLLVYWEPITAVAGDRRRQRDGARQAYEASGAVIRRMTPLCYDGGNQLELLSNGRRMPRRFSRGN